VSEKIRFDRVIEKVAVFLNAAKVPWDQTVVVRDIYGKIRILFNFNEKEKLEQSKFLKNIEEGLCSLGPYFNRSASVFCACDLIESECVFNDPYILNIILRQDDNSISLRLLERQIVGHDWLRPKSEQRNNPIPRLAFYGFKGGVGRSTTIAAIAFLLAQQGKKVLVIDFDLESPGLSSMLLPCDKYPEYGVVDWLVEDAVGNVDDLLLRDIVASSPLAADLEGNIKTVPAMGAKTDDPRIDPYYVSKLSRIYADVPRSDGGMEHFSDRLERLVEVVEKQENPDVVLIDCRAGLHDLSAGSIVRITDESFLFIVDTPQSWEGYHMLFSHWNQCPALLAKIRDKLNVVHAMVPEKDRRAKFLEKSYLLFAETVYEQSDPSRDSLDEDVPHNFDEDAQEAPHYPIGVFWNSSLSEFDVHSFENKSIRDAVELTYKLIFEKVQQTIQGYTNE